MDFLNLRKLWMLLAGSEAREQREQQHHAASAPDFNAMQAYRAHSQSGIGFGLCAYAWSHAAEEPDEFDDFDECDPDNEEYRDSDDTCDW